MDPTPSERSVIHERITRTWQSHPVVTLSGIVAFVTFLVSIWPAFVWLSGHFESAEEARQMELRIRRETVSMRVQLVSNQQTVARNRKNDCDIRRSSGVKMSDLEQIACAQYDEDYRAATVRLDKANADAASAYRDR